MPLPRVLYLLHQSLDNPGGIELHTRALFEGLSNRYEVSAVWRHLGQVRLARGGDVVEYPGELVPWPETPYRSPRTEEALAQVLDAVRPDLVHVQHFIHWPLSVLDQLLASDARVVVSLHDFYGITPYFTMQGTQDPEYTFTAAYTQAIFQSDMTAYLSERREILGGSFARVHALVVNSPFLKRTMAKIYPCDFRVIEYGIRRFQREVVARTGGLRLGCVGHLIPQKGWEYVRDAFPAVRERHPDAELRFYGQYSGSVPPVPPDSGMSCHGLYRPAELPRICGEFDVAVIPSIFAETYCLVLSEIWMAGLPVAVSDIGALAERVTDGVNGKKFEPGDVASIAETLNWFAENDEWRTWRLPRPKELRTMLDDYDRLYRELLGGNADP